MANICTVCTHPDVKEINKRLVLGHSRKKMCEEYGFSYSALDRHRRSCVPQQLAAGVKSGMKQHGIDVLQSLQELIERTEVILAKAEDNNSNWLALNAIKELRNTYETIAKIQAYIMEKTGAPMIHSEEVDLGVLDDEDREALFRLNMKMLGQGHVATPKNHDNEIRTQTRTKRRRTTPRKGQTPIKDVEVLNEPKNECEDEPPQNTIPGERDRYLLMRTRRNLLDRDW